MKRLAILLAVSSGCAHELTNRQLAKYVVPVGAVVGVVTLAIVAGGCRQGCNLGEAAATR